MSVFDDDRYNELASSAFESAYQDELEKLASGALVGGFGRLAAKVTPWLTKSLPKAVASGARSVPTTAGAATKPGLLGRFVTRQTHALGLGKSLPAGATAEQIAAHEARLAHAGVTGAKPIYQQGTTKLLPEVEKEIAEEAAKKAKTGWGSRLKRVVQGGKFDEASEAARIGKQLTSEREAARRMYELTGGSIPGSAKALLTSPIQTMGAGWKSMPTWQKYLMGGFGAMQAKELAEMEGKTPEEKAEIIARSAVLAPLWLGTAGIAPLLPSTAAWLGGEEAAVHGAKALARATHPGQYPKKYELTADDVQAIREQALQEALNR